MTHSITLRVYRYKAGSEPHYDTFQVNVPDAANVLDAIERAWDDQDRTLTFRHACHHASCGSCGVRINGREKLPCVTPVADYPEGQPITVDPLRNFTVISDLAVDASPLYARMLAVHAPIDRPAEPLRADGRDVTPEGVAQFNRFENCLECGLCISACPAVAADSLYLGPAPIAGADRAVAESPGTWSSLFKLLDDDHSLWRCHSAWECTEVCPADVFPAEAIMRLRRKATGEKVRRLFGRGERVRE